MKRIQKVCIKKFFFAFAFVAALTVAAGGVAEAAACSTNRHVCVIKDLDETIVYKSHIRRNGWNPAREFWNDTAAWYIDYYKKIRKETFTNALPLLRIDTIDAIMEWGGGLLKTYDVVVFADDEICWLSWAGDDEWGASPCLSQVAKFKFYNDLVKSRLKKSIDELKDFPGGYQGMVGVDMPIFFMTFYTNNVPSKTFCSEIPSEKISESLAGKDWRSNIDEYDFDVKQYNKLADLFKSVRDLINTHKRSL